MTSQAFTIYGIGRSYMEHVAELKNEKPSEPVVFLKSPASLRGLASGPLAFPEEIFAHEAELVVQMRSNFELGQKISWADLTHFALGLDLTRREKQSELKSKGLPWTLAKSFAGSALVGDFKTLTDEPQKKSLEFIFTLNGETKQHGKIRELTWPLPDMLTFINSFSPLKTGDIIFTGTPAGVGPIKKGDRFELSSPQLGSFRGQL